MVITTALALAKFVPDIIGLFSPKRGKQAQDAMEAVQNVASAVTGKSGDEAVRAIEADPELAYQFKIAVMADSHVSEQLEAEDRKSARDSYKVHHEQADKVAQSIMARNLPTVFLLVLVNIAGVIWLKDKGELIAIVSNIIGIVIGQLLAERQSVVGFFFGSSLGSKMKNGKEFRYASGG